MKKISIIFIPIILLFLLSSCKKNHAEYISITNYELLGEVPTIEFESISTTDVIEYEDTIIFTIFYQDGNGDIGTLDPDASTIELIDNRDTANLVFNYHLSPRAPAGTDIAIQGTLDVVLEHSIILDDSNASEETTFSLRIKDEAGNWSNAVESPTVTVNRQE